MRAMRRVMRDVHIRVSVATLRALSNARHEPCDGECDGDVADRISHILDDLATGLADPDGYAGPACRAIGLVPKKRKGVKRDH